MVENSLEQIQRRVKDTTSRLNLASTPELCALDLSSEVGEIAKEVLELTDYGRRGHIYNPDLARELGDAFYSLISLANIYDINLETQLDVSLKKYELRELRRGVNHQNLKVKLEPIVLAKNFLCLNAVAGCRNNCIYCYKHGWDIENKFIPQRFCETSAILNALQDHRYYHPNIPLAVHNSATDPFQEGVTDITFEILDGMEEMGVTNIVGLITKEYLSEEIIDRLQKFKYLRLVVFVTFSFLPREYERVISERRLQTMKNLSKSGLKRILYYRPIIKGVNDSCDIAQKVAMLGEKYFNCIVRSSLKVDVNTVEYMAKQGIFIDPGYDIGLNIHDSAKKMPADSRAQVDSTLAQAKVPYFKKTSCAISWLFAQPDYNCQWVRQEQYCSPTCPLDQKETCSQAAVKKPQREEIDRLCQHLGLSAPYRINPDHVLLESDKVFYSDVKYLRMALGFPVLVSIAGEALTAEEYDTRYINTNREEVRKLVKKLGIPHYS